MANRFLNNITINDEYTLPSADGTADQIITTDGAGQLSFVDQSTINAGNAEHVVIYAKNTSGASISKGTPVYITGTVGATDTVEIAPADAGNSAKMPAVGLLDDTLANNAFGYVITGGFMDNITTDPIDGSTPSSNDTVYVKAGGGLTLTKPTGSSNLIQNVAKVGKVSGGNSGSLIVSSILRTNDVPNLSTGKIWVGDGNTTESTVVHLDETNNRLGVNQTSPIGAVHIVGPNTNPAMTTSALVVEQGDGAKILIDGNDIDAVAGMLYLNDYSTNDVVFGGQIRVGGGGSPVGNSWFANGNVGIGTTSPSAKLEVNGDIALSGDNKVYSEGDTLTLMSGGTNGTYLVIDDTSGHVGIGTTSPSSALQVNGDLTVGDDSTVGSFINVIAAGASQDAGIRFGSESNTDSKAAIYTNTSNSDLHFDVTESTRMLIDSGTGNVGIGTTSPNENLHVLDTTPTVKIQSNSFYPGAGISFTNSADNLVSSIYSYSNPGGSGLDLSYENYGTTSVSSKIQLKNGFMYFWTAGGIRTTINSSGNVGIGLTNPSQKLDVNGSAKISGNLYLGSYIIHNGDTNTWLGFPTNDTISFRTNGSDRMYINSSGNVGIGTTSPSEKLHVQNYTTGESHQAMFKGGAVTVGDYSYISLNNGYSAEYNKEVRLAAVSEQSNSNKTGFAILTSPDANGASGHERLRVTADGNVGIGTTSPTALLTLESSSTSPYPGIDIKSTATYAGSEIRFLNSSGSEISAIESYSNPGRQDITVRYTGSTSGGKVELQDNAAVLGAGTLGAQSYAQVGITDFRVVTNYGTRMYINTSGDVGIGTTSPAYLFDVAGDGRVNGKLRCVTLIQTSQRDQKKDIADIDKTKAKAIPFKEYKYKSSIDGSERKRYGVVAEDIENDYPELVHIGADGIKGINYIDLLVKRVAELEKELEDISLTPGPKGDTGATGPAGADGRNGSDGRNGADGNDHLKNVQSIVFNEKSGLLEITIEGYKEPFRFNQAK